MKESMNKFLKNTRQSIVTTLILMLICGFIFPALLNGLSLLIFPKQANGSLIKINEKTIGAQYVGQEFHENYYLWSRPSAYHYNVYTEDDEGHQIYADGSKFSGPASGSENLAPSNSKLSERVKKDLQTFLDKNPTLKAEDIPTDLLTASGSGIDPHISPQSAKIQVPRIVAASGLEEKTVQDIIENHTEHKLFGFLGEEKVNVLMVNIEIARQMGIF